MSLERFEALLLICAVVAMLARRVRLPYTVGLVVTGAVLAFSPIASGAVLTRELLYGALLPPLVFEGALHIPWRDLRRELPVVLSLATLGVLISAGITAAGMRYLAG